MKNQNIKEQGTEKAMMNPDIYTKSSIWDIEQKRIFKKSWIAVAREEDITNVGDYYCSEVASQPLIIVRTEDNSIKALSAVCSHRNAILKTGSGSCSQIVCPYHAWSFSLTGKLNSVSFPDYYADLDKALYSLDEFRCEVWQGFVFVNLEKDSIPLEKSLLKIEQQVQAWNIANMKRVFDPIVREGEYNWKIACENVGDSHHVIGVHPASILEKSNCKKSIFSTDDATYMRMALPVGDGTTPSGVFTPIPDDIPDDFKGTWSYVIYPLNVITIASDFVVWQEVQPISATMTRSRFHVLAPDGALDSLDESDKYDIQNEIEQVIDEDESIFLSVGTGSKAAHKKYAGPVSKLEQGAKFFQDWYLRTMFA